MKLSELQDDQVVRLRLGRADRNGVEWSPWRDLAIYLTRREKTLRRAKMVHLAGEILTLVPKAGPLGCWAEYGQRDYCAPNEHHPHGVFIVEDYYMEIEGLEP